MKTYLILILVFLLNTGYAQNRNSVWCFGDSAGIDFSSLTNPSPISSSVNARGSCISVSDSLGNLIFYGSTFYHSLWQQGYDRLTVLYNNTGQVMNDGDTIIGTQGYNELVIIPMPNNINQYIIFSVATGPNEFGLFYSTIDMSLNGGLGQVILKNIQLTPWQPINGIVATKHGNGRDWWLIMKLEGSNNGTNNVFFNYLISPSGISSPIVDSVGSNTISQGGQLAFSKDGSKFVLSTWADLIELYDFDRCTGHLSNPVNIEMENHGIPGLIFSVAFSPSGNLLYRITNQAGASQEIGYLYQYDLTASNITASKILLHTFNVPEVAGCLQRAPDDKIYLSNDYNYYFFYPDSVHNNINEYLSVINQPNNLGAACDFQPYSFYLGGKRTYYGLPNNPDYEMYALGGSSCDTLGYPNAISNMELAVGQGELHVFYHNGWQVAFINAQGLKGKNYVLGVYDLMGREVFKEEGTSAALSVTKGYFTKDLNCAAFAKGMYVVRLQTEREVMNKKFVKE